MSLRVPALRLWSRTIGLVAASSVLATCSAATPAPAPPAAPTGGRTAPTGEGADPARTYHVSTHGDDAADGLTPDTAWRTLSRAGTAVLAPGDRLLLEGGGRFPGTLELGPDDAGDPDRPVVVGAYGSGGPVIEAAGGPGVVVRDTGGVEIDALTVLGDAASYAGSPGILLTTDRTEGPRLAHVHLTRIEVAGFRRGVELAAGGATGFSDVLVERASLHDNTESGFASHGPELDPAAPAYAHENVVLRDVAAFRNVGDPTVATRNTGSGAILGSVRGGLVERSRFHDNGEASRASEGPLGMWAYDSTGVVIQHSVAYRNRTGEADGGGFGLDVGVSDSVIQYNLTYDNDGPGFQLYTWRADDAHTRNTMRFNISHDDARRTDHGALTVLGRVNDSSVYQNTVVCRAGSARSRPPVVLVGDEVAGVSVRGNVLVGDGAAALVQGPAAARGPLVVQGNDYWAGAGAWAVRWGDATYPDLDAWRAGSGQETLGGAPLGLAVDPVLVDPAAPVDTAPVDTDRPGPDLGPAAPGLRLAPGSPLVGRGPDLAALGVDAGPVDFYGTPLGAAPDTPGAHRPAAG